MLDKKVVVITTGGTIAMRYDEATKGLVPAVSGQELMNAVPELKNVCKIEVVEFSNIPSPHMTPKMMKALGDKVDEIATDKNVAGIVITHGTDTLEETAYFLDLYIKTEKPVVFTGSMRGATEIGFDGARNILNAVKVASTETVISKGVMVVFNDTIHSAEDVIKTHTTNVDTFKSPFSGAIGYVDSDKVIFKRDRVNRVKIDTNNIEESIYLIKCFTGMNSDIFDFLIDKKIAGVVVEGFGRGNLPPLIVDGIKSMIDANIIVVLVSRVIEGRVLDVYSYIGGVKPMKEVGVILGGELTGQKARLKLMLLMGRYRTKNEIEKYFD